MFKSNFTEFLEVAYYTRTVAIEFVVLINS